MKADEWSIRAFPLARAHATIVNDSFGKASVRLESVGLAA
jgi:hypothetical protein